MSLYHRLNRLLALLFALLSISTLAQVPTEFNVTLNWQPDTEKFRDGLEGFEGAVPADDHASLPKYIYTVEIPTRVRAVSHEFIPGSTRSLGKNGLSADELSTLSSQYKVEVEVKRGGSGNYLCISVIPFRRTSANGTAERLNDFTIRLQESTFTPSGSPAGRTADHSVLAEGEWYRIATANDGVYRIDRPFLQSLGVDTDNLNPSAINIYGNGGEQLPYNNDDFYYDDLVKNAIFVQGESDGEFGANDFILFYAKGPDTWGLRSELEPSSIEAERFVHHKHHFSDSAYYYIRVDDVDPKRIQVQQSLDDPATKVVTKFQDRMFFENDITNLIKGGREFYGESFSDIASSFSYTFNAPNTTNDPAYLKAAFAVRSIGTESSFTMSVDGTSGSVTPNDVSTNATSNVANLGSIFLDFIPNDGVFTVNISFDASNPSAQGWLDYLQLNMTRQLQMPGTSLQFRDTTGINPGAIAEFRIGNANFINFLWDVTDPTGVFGIQGSVESNTYIFRQPASELREYFAFNTSAALEPRAVGRVENQDLHALSNIDMVIVVQPGLAGSAATLAQHHQSEGLEVVLVTQQQVFNEFSGGNRDVSALKLMMKMLYDKAGLNEDEKPKYLLLFGDGSYNNKSTTGDARNYLLTYQSLNSISPVNAFVSDDYFGFLDDNEGEDIEDKLDIGIGRLPVSTVSEANVVVNKILAYTAPNTGIDLNAFCGGSESGAYGSWRNLVAFVSDDQDGNVIDGNIHMRHSDEHADSIYTKYNELDVVKIYLDAYQQNSTPGGERYPEAEEAVRRRVENGALVVNYIGHGGERGWAHERLLTIPTIKSWSNSPRLPLFMTATCELARFDDPDYESAGELILLNANGGAIALLTTTRIVYSASNQQLGRAFYNHVFERENNLPLTFGEITMNTKNDVNAVFATTNMRNFTLLGDPAVRLATPQMKVYSTELNGMDIAQGDTIRALQEATITGFVGDENGNKLTGFNGVIYPTVFDKMKEVSTLDNDDVNPYDYDVFENIIYKGKVSVVNGDFSFSFPVPRDISYSFGNGRVSYYAVESEGSLDSHGHSQEFFIGGVLEGAELNTVGPDIELFLNDERFVNGGTTSQEPVIFAKVFDDNGINTVGNGIGHDITAVIDGDVENTIILNDYYEADLDTYQSGQIRYQLTGLEEGEHTLSLKVWDAHNNSSQAEIDFVVASSEEIALEHVLNYPNPFTTNTQFFFEHNQSCQFLDVRIQVFTVSGKLVKTIDRTVLSEGFRSEGIAWDGLDDFGDRIGRGVYVYRLEVSNPIGQSAETFEKLVILR